MKDVLMLFGRATCKKRLIMREFLPGGALLFVVEGCQFFLAPHLTQQKILDPLLTYANKKFRKQ